MKEQPTHLRYIQIVINKKKYVGLRLFVYSDVSPVAVFTMSQCHYVTMSQCHDVIIYYDASPVAVGAGEPLSTHPEHGVTAAADLGPGSILC